jgi:hypothetical protein
MTGRLAISMFHSDETRPVTTARGHQVQKLLCLTEYSKFVGGIDNKDQLLQMYVTE